MKYKILPTGTLVTCDGSRHYYKAVDEDNLKNQPNSALCWCQSADKEQAGRWSETEAAARDISKSRAKVAFQNIYQRNGGPMAIN